MARTPRTPRTAGRTQPVGRAPQPVRRQPIDPTEVPRIEDPVERLLARQQAREEAEARPRIGQETLERTATGRYVVDPTPTINVKRPRTHAMAYDAASQTLRVIFRDGTPWEYYDVPPRVAQNMTKVQSIGRAIRRYGLDNNPMAHGRGNFDYDNIGDFSE